MTRGQKLLVGDAILGGGAIFLGLVVASEAIHDLETNASLFGPALSPALIAFGLCAIGAVLLRQAFRVAGESEQVQYDLIPVTVICAGLLLQMALMTLVGWIPSAALVFTAAAFAFGSRQVLRDAVIGLGVGVITFVLFTYMLDIRLPLGSLVEMVTQ